MGHHSKKKPVKDKQSTKEKLNLIRKERKQKLKAKRARLVVHNLPFEANAENLKEHFAQFGEIDNVEVLKRENGQLKGCGFVQFKLVQKAAKARHHTNGKPFLGRDIRVDFAQPKNKYTEKVKVKEEKDELKIKEEPVDGSEVKDTGETEDIIIDEDSDSDNQDSDESSQEDEEEDQQDEEVERKPRWESNDVGEGRTIFIKNVPFQATGDDVKECMSQFGSILYAVICIDKLTQHSKGTAFVKFQKKDDADKALEAGTELKLMGNILDCHKALGQNEVQQINVSKKDDKSMPKDSRNLFLIKEGVVLAGTKAAEGVSAADMAKRLQLEQHKTQMLRNLNMFISRNRLLIHNLPPSWNDDNLRNLFKKYAPKSAIIKEAKVMRDLKNVDANGVGQSKEYGFVSFTKHEDALAVLRVLNNNPKIFTAHKRPIVAFSIENKSMIRAKEKRLEKSMLRNSNSKKYDPSVKASKEKKTSDKQVDDVKVPQTAFMGVAAKPGVQKMRSRYNLKTQAQLHHETLKKEKKRQKFAKKTFKQRAEEFTKQPKQKIGKKKDAEEQNFSKLVSNYKNLLRTPAEKKTKWFEG